MCKDKYCKEVYAEFDKLHDYYREEISKLKSEIKNWEYKYYELVNVYAGKLLKDK